VGEKGAPIYRGLKLLEEVKIAFPPLRGKRSPDL